MLNVTKLARWEGQRRLYRHYKSVMPVQSTLYRQLNEFQTLLTHSSVAVYQ